MKSSVSETASDGDIKWGAVGRRRIRKSFRIKDFNSVSNGGF